MVDEVSSFFHKQPAVGVIFDGTTRQGELMAVLLRAVTEDFTIVQKLVSLHTFPSSVNSRQIVSQMKATLTEPRGALLLQQVCESQPLCELR